MKPFRSGSSCSHSLFTALSCFAQVTDLPVGQLPHRRNAQRKVGAKHVEKKKTATFPSFFFYVLYKRLTTFLTSSKHLAQRTELSSLSI